MNKEKTIKDILDILEKDKWDFSKKIQKKIEEYITKENRNCLTIVKRSSTGKIIKTYKPSAKPKYALQLIRFCWFGKKYPNLDSGLTDPIIDIVVTEYKNLYNRNTTQISDTLIKEYLSDKNLSRNIIKTLVTSTTSKNVKGEVVTKTVEHIVSQMEEALSTTTMKTLKENAVNAVSGTTASVVGKKILLMLSNTIKVHLKYIILKVLATPVVKKMIVVALKKYIIAAIGFALLKLISAKLSIGIGAVFVIILIPVIVAWIAKDIKKFPKKLGKKVGEEVAKSIRGEYHSINRNITEEIVKELVSITATQLGDRMAKDPNSKLGNTINNLVNQFS